MGYAMPRDSGQSTNRRKVLKSVTSAGVVGVTTSFAGCSSNQQGGTPTPTLGEPSDGQDWPDLSGQSIHVLTDEGSEPFQKFFNRVAADFSEATGANVNNEYAGLGGNADQRLIQLLQVNDPPEVFLTSASQATQFINQGVAGKVNHAVEAVSKKFGDPTEKSLAKSGGDNYLFPLWANIGFGWHRMDKFSQIPQTWDQLLNEAKNADNPNGTRGTLTITGSNICTSLQLLDFAYANGAKVAEYRDGEFHSALNSGGNHERWVETLSYLQDLHEYSPVASGMGCGAMANSIPTETAYSICGSGGRPKVRSVKRGRPFAGDVRCALQPTPTDSSEQVMSRGLSEGFTTFKQANRQAANVYMEFLAQPKYLNEIYFLTPLHNVPVFPKIAESDSFQQRLEELPDAWAERDYQIPLKSANKFQTLATETSEPNPYAGAIYSSNELPKMLYNAVVNDTNAEKAVNDAHSRIEQVISDAK